MSQPPGQKGELRAGDVAPVEVFVEHARTTVDFNQGAGCVFDETDVPETLQHLIPLARRWGFADNGSQTAFLENLQRNHPQEVEEFVAAVSPQRKQIHEWVCSHIEAMTSAVNPAVSAICNLAEMYDLAKPLDPSLIANNVARSQHEKLEREKQVAIEQSLAAMKKRDFDGVVRLLRPYETQLRGADEQRLSIAKTRSGCD
jgi:hypothetical protein